MFRVACSLACQFTWPVVLSHATVAGKCYAAVGSCVVVNRDGWFVTAGHILKELDRLSKGEAATAQLRAQTAAIQADTTIGDGERRRRLKGLGAPKGADIEHCSMWPSKDGVRIAEGYTMANADLGVGRFEPFDPTWVNTYPTFKDPTKDFEPGTSLCRTGFPFHQIAVNWDAAAKAFRFAPGALPLPFFPIEGIFTRTAEIVLVPGLGQPAINPPWPHRMIETSSPGIPGQSGGPIFDIHGRIWGIQCSTVSYPLELNTKERQYLNVGLGIHPETIFGLFADKSVAFTKSTD